MNEVNRNFLSDKINKYNTSTNVNIYKMQQLLILLPNNDIIHSNSEK